jgi:hypothetical protein
MSPIIGVRKMAVIMWSCMMIALIELAHIYLNQPSDATTITLCGLIAGLGGFHAYKQGLIDIKNGHTSPPEKK